MPNIFLRRESNVRSYCRRFSKEFFSASGATLTDTSGNTYIDFLAGCSSLNYGHNDPDMKAALISYIQSDGIAHGLDLHTAAKLEFLTCLEKNILTRRTLDHKVMFTGPTGTNAVEAALKIARKATGRTNVIAFTNAFHGVTVGAVAATGNRLHRNGANYPLSGGTRIPFDGYVEGVKSAALLRRMLQDKASGVDAPAAILLEIVQAEGGLNVASKKWLNDIAAVSQDFGALLIIDDIQCGCGRAGTFFSFEGTGIIPDIVTMAKSISGFGLPMALLMVRPQYDVLAPAEHNGTFRGNTHAFVTAKIAIEKFWSCTAFEKTIELKSRILHNGLQKIETIVPNSRLKGLSMIQGIDVGSAKLADEIVHSAFQQGLIIETSGPEDQVVKVLAPLTIEENLLLQGLDILLYATEQAMKSQDPSPKNKIHRDSISDNCSSTSSFSTSQTSLNKNTGEFP